MFGNEPAQLGKALVVYGAAAPAGVFLGGVITEYLSWPWVSYINVPIAVIELIANPALMPAGAVQRGSTGLLGAITVTAGLAVAVDAIVRAPEAGWASAETVVGLILAAVLLGNVPGRPGQAEVSAGAARRCCR